MATPSFRIWLIMFSRRSIVESAVAADEELPEEDDQLLIVSSDDEVLSALQELTAFVEGLVIPSKMTALTIQGIAQLSSSCGDYWL